MDANGNVERVEELWKEMIGNGIKPNDYTYNTLIKANINDTKRVEEILKEMIEKGVKPTWTHFSILL